MVPLSIVLLLGLSTGVSLAVAAYIARARQAAPGARALVVMLLAVSAWSAAYLLQLQATSVAEKLWWAKFGATGTSVAVVAYLVFVVRYTERDHWLTPSRLALFGVVPAVTTVAAWTNPVHNLVWRDPATVSVSGLEVLVTTTGPLMLLAIAYGYVVVIAGAVLISLLAVRADPMYRGQATTLLAATLLPLAASVVFYVLPRSLVPFDPTPLLLSVMALMIAYALHRYHMFTFIPVAPSMMIEELHDGVVVLDRTDRISHLNPAAKRLLGLTDGAIGQSADAVIPGWGNLQAAPSARLHRNELQVTVDGDERVFETTASPLSDYGGRFLGRQLLFRDVTERTRYERTLEQYRMAFETVTDAVFVFDADGTIRLVNESFSTLVGRPIAALQGMHASEVFGQSTYDATQAYLTELAAEEPSQERASMTREFTLETADGRTVPCELELSVLPVDGDHHGCAGVVRDITRRKRVQRSLAETTSTLETVFEASPLAIVTIDADARVTRWNPAASELFGWLESEAVGEHLPELVDLETGEACCDRILAGDTVTNEELRWRTRDGITREVSVSGAPLGSQRADVTGAVLLAADITDRKHREQQLEVLSRILRHNIRNDMSVILPQTELLREDLPEARRRKLADEVVARSRKLVEYSAKARQAERVVDHGTARDEFDVAAVARRSIDRARRRHPTASFSMTVQESATVLAQETLDVAVANLLDNAVEHNDSDRPEVSISVTVQSSEAVRMDIADNGPGIPEAEQEVLLDGEESPLHHGSGIGLWLVNWIVDRSGGDLSFSQNDPRGSVVSLTLPRSKEAETEHSAQTA